MPIPNIGRTQGGVRFALEDMMFLLPLVLRNELKDFKGGQDVTHPTWVDLNINAKGAKGAKGANDFFLQFAIIN